MNTQETIELLPCPFCGGTDIDHTYIETFSTDSSYEIFGCRDCGANFNAYKKDCTEDWNRRTISPELRAAIIAEEMAKCGGDGYIAFQCNNCEAVYLDTPVSRCECSHEETEYTEGRFLQNTQIIAAILAAEQRGEQRAYESAHMAADAAFATDEVLEAIRAANRRALAASGKQEG